MTPKRYILKHSLDIGDCCMLTIALRDLHMAYSGEYITDIRTRWPDLFLNNPYVTPLGDHDAEILEVGYPSIQNPGTHAFSDAFRLHLSELINRHIPFTSSNPDIHLTDTEKAENIVEREFGYSGKYIVLSNGYKADVILKWYPFFDEVVQILKNDIMFVTIGAANDHHFPIDNTLDLVGKTSLRDLIKVIYRSEMTVGGISVQMVLAAAFGKPAVVVAGGKEPASWQRYNYHRYLDVVGCLPCCPVGGCWRAKWNDCTSRAGGVPRCFAMISPKEVARNVLLYYKGGVLSF